MNRLQVAIVTASGGMGGTFPAVAEPGSNCSDLNVLGGELGMVSTEQAAARFVGVAVHADEPLSAGQLWVLRTGLIRDVDTSAWAAGETLWADATGQPTNVFPPATRGRVRIGIVMAADALAGSVFVDVRVLPAIGDLTGVDVATIADLQVLQWRDDGGTLTLQNVQPGDPSTVAPLDTSARVPDQHLRWSRFLMLMGG